MDNEASAEILRRATELMPARARQGLCDIPGCVVSAGLDKTGARLPRESVLMFATLVCIRELRLALGLDDKSVTLRVDIER